MEPTRSCWNHQISFILLIEWLKLIDWSHSLPLHSVPIQSPFISLINAERMKCGLNWSESGPVPLRSFVNSIHSIQFNHINAVIEWNIECDFINSFPARFVIRSCFTHFSQLAPRHDSLQSIHYIHSLTSLLHSSIPPIPLINSLTPGGSLLLVPFINLTSLHSMVYAAIVT